MPTPPMPVRRLHNYAYCKRLFYLQWVEDLWVEDSNTAAGSHLHRNTDKPSHWKDDLDLAERASLRSLSLESETLGLRGVIDIIEDTGAGREILDYKRGSARRDENDQRIAKENDALQLAAYALLLEEAKLPVVKASIYYGAERSRIPVHLTDSLFDQVRQTITAARATAESGQCPPPLIDDPRCLHCSAYSICLPNESAYWSGNEKAPLKDKEPPRPPGDQGEIVVIQNARAYLACRNGELHVRLEGEVVSKHPLEQVQSVYFYGAVQASTPNSDTK